MVEKRYELLGELEHGNEGSLHHARDRLTGSEVAFKQLHFELASEDAAADRLRWIRELGRLASLRHPNLVSVLDYGFDSDLKAFYTRTLTTNSLSILDVGRDCALGRKIELLIGAFQALVYLHRRGVFHGRLDHITVRVHDDRAQLVDFGLPALHRSDRPPPTATSDLDDMGLITYELLCGRHPYDDGTLRSPKPRAPGPAGKPLELSTRDFDARLIPVLGKLLVMNPERRYSAAHEVIQDLTSMLGQPPPKETAAIRDSFLRATPLVGRQPEMEQLQTRLESALSGRGSSMLIAGESGVGTSRLLEELHNLSLAQGVRVLRNRAIAEGFDPFQPWRDILRHLCLLVPVDNATAAELKRQVADIDELLGREVRNAPAADTQTIRQHFQTAVERLFRRLKRPAVVIVEDLHWAGSESLTLLARLCRIFRRLPILMVGTYRDDERPDLAAVLGEMPLLKLNRLDQDSVAEIAVAMLGERVRPSRLAGFLHKETGGNAFFVVEIVRSLAEEAGSLDRIDLEVLPESMSTGGIQRVLDRRLGRVPRRALPLLRLAAVAGNQIDLELLTALEKDFLPDLWLRSCSDAAVLEVHGGGWRFTHDHLREGLLRDLAPHQLRAAHRQVAQAIETAHGSAPERTPALAHHWTLAADLSDSEATGKAADYLKLAGTVAIENCATREGQRLLSRGLELCTTLPPTRWRLRQEIAFQVDLGAVHLMSLGDTAPAVGEAFARARRLCEQTNDSTHLLATLLGLWRYGLSRGDFAMVARLSKEVTRHTEERQVEDQKNGNSGRASDQLVADYVHGSTLFLQGWPEPALPPLQRCIDLFASLQGTSGDLAESVFVLGENPGVSALGQSSLAYWSLGFGDHARGLAERAQMLADMLGHPFSQAFAYTVRAWLDHLFLDAAATESSAREAMEFCQEQDFPVYLGLSNALYGWALAERGETEEGIRLIRQFLDQSRIADSHLHEPYILTLLAGAQARASLIGPGLEALDQALQSADRMGTRQWKGEIHRLRGELTRKLPRMDVDNVESCFFKALEMARKQRQKSFELRALLSLARLRRGDTTRSGEVIASLRELYEDFTEGFDSADLREARQFL